ncbi:MAG: hypothetical protein PUB22_08335, partial [Clostridiales bacterium]|nr:hypothetical protein [Clostridiales bacterium]
MADRLSLERICLQLTVEKNLVNSRGRVLPFGLNLKITKSSDIYTMKDEVRGEKIFPHGYLAEIKDANGNRVCLLYNRKAYSDSNGWYPAANSSSNQLTKMVHLTASAYSNSGKENRVTADVVTGLHGVNLLKNGGFESGTLTWTNTPYGNDVTQLSAVVGDYRSAGGVRSGAKSMR